MRPLTLSELKACQRNGKALSGFAMVSGRWLRPQPTSAGTNFSAFSPKAQLGEIQPLSTKLFVTMVPALIALLKNCPNY